MRNFHTLKKILFLAFILICAFITWFSYEIITDGPPDFFPLNDTNAEYRVTKKCPHGQGWQPKGNGTGDAYCVEYTGDNLLEIEGQEDTKFFRITVGTSKKNLAPFLDKKITNLKGKFTSASQQCTDNACTPIGGPFAVLNLESFESAQ